MLTRLIFPPQWIPTQPYLSLPSLTAFLTANSCRVSQMDINISFYDHILSREMMGMYFSKAQSKFHELEARKELPPDLQKHYAALASSILFGDYVIKNVEEAKSILKNKEDFYNIEKLFMAFRTLELGLKMVSSAFYPTNLTFHSYDMSYSCRSSTAVIDALNDSNENLFVEYFEKFVLADILEDNPGLIGISIINTSQLIPGLTLANLIKKTNPGIHVNIGGSVFTRLIDELSNNAGLFSIFDSVIVHEGETALLALIDHLTNESDLRDIPNLIYKDGNEIKVNRLSSEGEDVNSLPTPCFDGFPLDTYLSPELIIPLLSSRGCYWNRCTFCDHGYGYSGKYRPRDTDLLFNDIRTLKEKYHTNFFTFQDEGISAKLIKALSEKILEHNMDISWLADSRFEYSFSQEIASKLSKAGCRMLYFGLESSNERVLKCMDKGIKMEQVLKICRYCNDAGIWAHMFLIFGFPTETEKEARETMNFILEHADIIRSMSFGSFQLTRHSRVYENPSLFGISKIFQNNDLDLSLWYECEVETGMPHKETDQVIQEFYGRLAQKYSDLPIWSNLDREHLFLYIGHYKNSIHEVADLSRMLEDLKVKKRNARTSPHNRDTFPVLNEGIFMGTFNFNLARIVYSDLKGNNSGNLQRENVNVIFDINNNRIFTISDLLKDIIEKSNDGINRNGIIDFIKVKYQLPYHEAENKFNNSVKGLLENNIVCLK